MNWREFGNVMLIVAAGLSCLFGILYALAAPWYRSAMGRSILSVLVSLGIGMIYFSWAANHTGRPEQFWAIRALIFCGITAAQGVSVTLFLKAQLKGGIHRGDSNELENARQVVRDADGVAGDGGGADLPRPGR
jgi:peptidoglycan/LPS O-acetylase OafA/YrhL